MKELILFPLVIIADFIDEFIFRPAIASCPPLLILIVAIMIFFSNGCLPKIAGIVLFLIGIIAMIIWLLYKVFT
ncbi:MAG: hypothetical protein IJ862_05045 [Selenomonadaceae bacterium]|nr:hypothetical protein [Selenomonadaceae bacterium]